MIRLGGTGTRAYCGDRCRRVRRNRFRRLVETGSEEPLGRFERDVRRAFGTLEAPARAGGLLLAGAEDPNVAASRHAREQGLRFSKCLRFDRRARAAAGSCIGCGVALG